MASSSRGVQQDSFIDEEEDTCPLCVEEFDLSDKNFKPCPCGYQVCQFCFNNIKEHMNGLCPACRRPYSEETMEFKIVTQEQIAQFKANAQKNAKKKAAERQKEAQKREVESLSRKHLSGLRVVQRNLVYVMGLSPGTAENELLQTLRGDKYFGQYGKIIKIAVGKQKPGESSASGLGVYVTFAKEEDAAKCILAVNGSQNGERVLRAQLGTTKYCSAYLRGETCTNKACMFLHEPGDNEDSYSRADLSNINGIGTQRPLPVTTPSSTIAMRQAAQAQAPIQQAQPVAAAAPAMARDSSKEGSDNADSSALPSSASWATRGQQTTSRRGSIATSGAEPSPAVSHAMPAAAQVTDEPEAMTEEEHTESPVPQVPRVETPLMKIVKSINSMSPIFENSSEFPVSTFPPLFDDFGGAKRRAAREQEEARMAEEAARRAEQDAQSEIQTIPDSQEEDAPESGSLQLGGEPEDRDTGRDSVQSQGFIDQRRPSAQMPISRTSIDSSSFSQNYAQTPSSRSMTPQQQQQQAMLGIFKSAQPQSNFMGQFPPGMGEPSQSSLFQQQGHNRQSSRYNFANDSTSAKGSSGAKMGGQPSSMMPPPQSSAFYGSSIQGPPPGLKSTGTPPNMFGQAPGFGGALGGFSGSRDSDIYRDMMRGRGGGTGDVGKREFMFPSFLNQYPSASSTPAPASGLLASLYGSQPGAFHDMSFKQKKKGKKHRHANTSSSGGSGLVDLADPHLLGRVPHQQQQNNAGVGQGLFGGQAADEPSPDELEAALAVDNLVSDEVNELTSIHPLTVSSNPSRTGTPSIPPGFEGHGHPSPPKTITRMEPKTAPFTPSRSTSFAYTPHVATPLANVSVPTTPVPRPATPLIPGSTSKAKSDLKTLATSTGLSKQIATQRDDSALLSTAQHEDFPALDKGKGKEILSTPTVKPVISAAKKTSSTAATPVVPATPTATKSTPKRSTSGVLSTEAMSHGPISTKAPAIEALNKVTVPSTSFPPLPPSNPPANGTQAASRPALKPLRIVSTSKADIAQTESLTPISTTLPSTPAILQTRQSNLASARFDRPGTPASEHISDVASIPSTISRPNSPPLSRIGSAPVREKTKSQQKKQRKERGAGKEKTELEVVKDIPEQEKEIGPIEGRKKKQKKDKSKTITGNSTPAASRPPSPVVSTLVEPVVSKTELVKESKREQIKSEPSKAPEPVKLSKSEERKAKAKAHAEAQAQAQIIAEESVPSPPPAPSAEADKEPEKPPLTPMSVLNDLATSAGIDPFGIALLKQLTASLNQRPEVNTDLGDFEPRLIITDEDRANLEAGRPVQKNAQGSHRVMLTPNGDCVRNLTPEEEQRYLELQKTIAENLSPATFIPHRYSQNNGFSLIQGRAVPNGPPSFFPPPHGAEHIPLNAVSKIQRDEALSYINQYVLPSLSTNSQLERALNANAIDAGMHPPQSNQPWGTWGANLAAGGDTSGQDSAYGGHTDGGILATGLESMTAHFAVGRDNGRGQPLGHVNLLSLADSESALQSAKKETEKLEKQFNQLLKKNRKLLLGAGH